MVGNDLLMQFQADLLGVPVIRPKVPETTSLGAAYAAGLATGFWGEVEDLRENWVEDKRWEPKMDAAERDEYYKYWKRAVTRTFDWFESEDEAEAARGRVARGRPGSGLRTAPGEPAEPRRWSASSSSPTARRSPRASSRWRARWAARRSRSRRPAAWRTAPSAPTPSGSGLRSSARAATTACSC